MLDLNDEECAYLRTLVGQRHSELLHELHHAVTREFKTGLKKEIELTETLKAKLAP